MREKLETLSLAKLKEFAKEQEIKGYGSMRKAELIDILCEKAGEKEGKSAPADEIGRASCRERVLTSV